jgi:hypothetical protein
VSALGSAARVSQSEPISRPKPQRDAEIRLLPPRPPRPAVAAPVAAPHRTGLGAFMGLLVGVLASGLFGLLLLNTTLGEGSFRIKAMQNAVSQLSDQSQQLQQQVALAESPIALQQRASALGMVPSGSPVFLRLTDGRVLGVPVPAVAPPKLLPPVVVKPTVAPTKPTVVPTKPTTATANAPTKTTTGTTKAKPKH